MRLRFLLRNNRNRAKLIVILLLVFAFFASAAAIIRSKENKSDSHMVFHPIKSIKTEENIYTITATLIGDEDEKDIDLLLSVCEGMGVNITFFAEADWVEDNKELAEKIAKNGTLGLYIKKDLSGKLRNYVMEYVASCNDDFFEASGKYPKYVRVSENPNQTLARILTAYGQYCISYDTVLTGGGTIGKGKIVDIGYIDENTAYLLAEAVGKAISSSLTCIKMESFLYKIGSETDEFGTQYA